jgi:tetratricopeptide (TPR) repeat protein/predicted Ser/Thr protein kinase
VETIGKYRVLRVLGRGGMGTVYEAEDPLIHRKVAVKTMIAGLSDNPDLRARFFREAQAAGGLRHRNIVTVYDLGEDKGQPYIAMEFIEGTDLEKIIQNKEPYSMEWKLDVLRQVCNGLAHAHRNGIVHRDVKPANIRVTPEGEVKIMDFGIAHLQSSTLTKSGPVLGTVHYMAPEQLDGKKVDHRADIFSVGAIAYELIAYRRPFDGDSLTAVMFKVMHEAPDRDGLPQTDYSPGLERIVLRALARDLGERYPSLDEMHDDLERLVRETAAKLAGGAAETGEDRAARAARLVEEGRRQLKSGATTQALALAKEAIALAAADLEAQALLRDAEAEALRKRVETEMAEIRAEMERARTEGRLPKALSLCRRLLELVPDDAALARTAKEIEAVIQDREVEQLCGLALAYAADGETDLALKIAGKIERIAPQSPRYLELKRYLDEESARRAAEAMTAAAREHLVHGNLTEARAAAEEALAANPSHAAAKEIRDRVSAVLATQERAARASHAGLAPAVPPPASAPRSSPAAQPPPATPPTPAERPAPAAAAAPATNPQVGPPSSTPPADPATEKTLITGRPTIPPRPTPPSPAVAAPRTPTPTPPFGRPGPAAPPPRASVPKEAARPATVPSATRPAPPSAVQTPVPATPAPPPPTATPTPSSPLSPEAARKAEIESLTTAALNHFVQNENAKARKAVEKALALDPQDKKAKELLKILTSLG